MTRINVIDPNDLTDQHLMAEYRELPMIMGSLRRSLKSKRGVDVGSIPSSYTLNTGHVRHFYNKGKWLQRRYFSLIAELCRRGYNVDPESRNVDWGTGIFNTLQAAEYQRTVEALVDGTNSKFHIFELEIPNPAYEQGQS